MKLKSPLKIAIAGLGTVGVGLIRQLDANGALLERRCGRKIQIVAVSARNKDRDRGINIQNFNWFENPEIMAEHADVDVIVELIGGQEGVAKAICEKSLATGKSVVTANKALIAHYGFSLANYADGGLAGELYIFNPSNTVFVKHFHSTFNYMFANASPHTMNVFIGGYFATTSAINTVSFAMSSGNFDGVIKMYGL